MLFIGASFLQYRDNFNLVYYFGIIYATVAAFLSGVAGVWLKYVYKRDPISLWIKNIILASISIPLQSILMLRDFTKINEDGFFQGFNKSVVNNHNNQ